MYSRKNVGSSTSGSRTMATLVSALHALEIRDPIESVRSVRSKKPENPYLTKLVKLQRHSVAPTPVPNNSFSHGSTSGSRSSSYSSARSDGETSVQSDKMKASEVEEPGKVTAEQTSERLRGPGRAEA